MDLTWVIDDTHKYKHSSVHNIRYCYLHSIWWVPSKLNYMYDFVWRAEGLYLHLKQINSLTCWKGELWWLVKKMSMTAGLADSSSVYIQTMYAKWSECAFYSLYAFSRINVTVNTHVIPKLLYNSVWCFRNARVLPDRDVWGILSGHSGGEDDGCSVWTHA